MNRLIAFGLAGLLLVAAALVGGSMVARAASERPLDEDIAPGAVGDGRYCEVFLDVFAAELGVERDALALAAVAAANAALDAAVEAGDLPAAAADRSRERIAEREPNLCPPLGERLRHSRDHDRVHFLHDLAAAAAESLDMEADELVGRLRDGDSLREVADEQGVDYGQLTDTIMERAGERLDAAVERGLITRERADHVLEHLRSGLEAGLLRPSS